MPARTVPAAPPARRRLSETERREQILRAALDIATRDGLDAVTARTVATEAGLSSGLVFFHFKSSEQLLAALAEYAMEGILREVPKPEAYAHAPAAEGFGEFLADRLRMLEGARERRMVELLLEVWVAGLRREAMRAGVRGAIERYRAAFVPFAKRAMDAAPKRFRGLTPEALATTAVALVIGTALQALADPRRFDHAGVLTTLRLLLAMEPAARAPTPSRKRAAKR